MKAHIGRHEGPRVEKIINKHKGSVPDAGLGVGKSRGSQSKVGMGGKKGGKK